MLQKRTPELSLPSSCLTVQLSQIHACVYVQTPALNPELEQGFRGTLTTVALSGEKYLPRRGDPSIHTCQDLPFLGIQSGTYSNVPEITKMLEKRSLGMVSGSFNSSQC